MSDKTIAEELTRLLETKEEMRILLGLERDVPFHKYVEHMTRKADTEQDV